MTGTVPRLPSDQKQTTALQGSEAAFSASRLRRLAEDLESDAAAISYASMFLEILPDRIERILSVLQGDDPSAAIDAVLSLKVRSHLVGGLALERDCRTLELSLRAGDSAAGAEAAGKVAADSVALEQALETFLQGRR